MGETKGNWGQAGSPGSQTHRTPGQGEGCPVHDTAFHVNSASWVLPRCGPSRRTDISAKRSGYRKGAKSWKKMCWSWSLDSMGHSSVYSLKGCFLNLSTLESPWKLLRSWLSTKHLFRNTHTRTKRARLQGIGRRSSLRNFFFLKFRILRRFWYVQFMDRNLRKYFLKYQ